jgi:hypothetical protein
VHVGELDEVLSICLDIDADSVERRVSPRTCVAWTGAASCPVDSM